MKWHFFILIALLMSACSPSERQKEAKSWMRDDGRLKVLSTTAMIGDLVENIGGNYVDNFVLIADELDPHSYQLVKGDDEKLARAQVIFFNGLNLEHGPSLKNALTNSKSAIGLGDTIKEKHPEKILHYGNQDDPHIWMDMSLWAEAIPFVVEGLSKAAPAHEGEFKRNGERYRKQLLEAHQRAYAKMHSIPAPKRYLVTSHDAFNYFARAYLAEERETANGTWQERFTAPEGLSPDSQLSATVIQNVIDYLDKYDIMVIFPESNVSKDSIRKIVDAGKLKGLMLIIATESLYGDAMGPHGSEGETYIKMIEHNVNVISKYLKNNGKEERQAALLR